MALEIVLTLDKTDLLYQQDAEGSFQVANTGKDSLRVIQPRDGLSRLRLRAVDLKTGVERLLRGPRQAGNAMPPAPSDLGPGKSMAADFPFLWFAADLAPGEYELSAVYPYHEPPEEAESKPVRIKIRPTTPKTLSMIPTATPVSHGVWINMAGEAPELVLLKFDTSPGGGAGGLRRLFPVPLRAVPVTSTGPGSGLVGYHWIAWTSDGAASVHHVDATGPKSLKPFPLPSPDAYFVSPLSTDLKTRENERPAGAALVYVPRDAQLVSFKLTVDGASRLAAAPLPGPKPLWITSVVREDKKRLAVYAQANGDRVSLSEIPWPGGGAPRALGEFKGVFLGAGGALGLADQVFRGTLILRTGAAAHLDLERIDFSVAPGGAFTAEPPVPIASDPLDPFLSVQVRLSERGARAALLQTQNGYWAVYDGKKTAILHEPLRRSPFPLDLAFHEGTEPVLLIGAKDLGFRILFPDGRPLPPKI